MSLNDGDNVLVASILHGCRCVLVALDLSCIECTISTPVVDKYLDEILDYPCAVRSHLKWRLLAQYHSDVLLKCARISHDDGLTL